MLKLLRLKLDSSNRFCASNWTMYWPVQIPDQVKIDKSFAGQTKRCLECNLAAIGNANKKYKFDVKV